MTSKSNKSLFVPYDIDRVGGGDGGKFTLCTTTKIFLSVLIILVLIYLYYRNRCARNQMKRGYNWVASWVPDPEDYTCDPKSKEDSITEEFASGQNKPGRHPSDLPPERRLDLGKFDGQLREKVFTLHRAESVSDKVDPGGHRPRHTDDELLHKSR